MTRIGRSGKLRIHFQLSVILIALVLPFYISASPFSVNGQLHVSGNQLVNECGSPVQLRGISSHGLQWYGLNNCFDFCCISASALDYMANTVGIDVFRIAMYPEPDGYIANPSRFTQQVNNIVQMCEDRGIYALIDWHVLTPGDPNADIVYARTFWESMATAHKDSRNVIYEICNEPNGVSWSQVVTYANDIIPRIRAIDPDAVIIVGTPNWSQLGSDVVNNKLSYSNIMYTFHFYAATHNTGMLTSFVGQLPIFVTEWAATEASGLGDTNYTVADSFISIMATNKISWCAWNWSESTDTSGMLNVGACDAANWSSYKPTGSYVVGKVSNPADSFTACNIATNTPTPNIVPKEVILATDLRLDSMTDGDYVSNICSNWYAYDDSNDCTDKNCTINAHGTSLILPWSKDHWQDLGRPVQNFYMQQPGHNGAADYAARITGVVTTTFLYGFAGLGFPLKEPGGPVDIHTATGLSFWCKSNESRTYRLKINAPQAFAGRLDEDMYGYVFTATTSWQKVSIDFASILFSQEGWGNTLVTRAMALAQVDTIQWQTQGQTGAPYNFDLWIDDVVLMNAPAALKTIATAGCGSANTFTVTPSRTPTATYTRTVTCTATSTATRTNTPANTFTFTNTATNTATRTYTPLPTFTNTIVDTPTFTRTATPPTATNTPTMTRTWADSPTFTHTRTDTATLTYTVTIAQTDTYTPAFTATMTPTITRTWTESPTFTHTPAFTATITPTITRTWTESPTFTHTRAYTATMTPTITPSLTLTLTLTLTFTGTPTLTDTPVNTPTKTATSGAYLTVQIIGTPNAGDTITVIMIVTNIGDTAADNVLPSGLAIAGTGGVSAVTSPSSMVSIPAEGTVAFTWTYNADSSGVVTFQGSASGIDAVGAWVVTSGLVTSNEVAFGVSLPTITFTDTPSATHTPANTFTGTPTAMDTPTVLYTPTNVFTATPTRTPVPVDAKDLKITDELVYPNPYNPGLGIPMGIRADFSQKHRNTMVEIYTSALRHIKEFKFPDSPWAGERTLSIPDSSFVGLASGSYYYIITTENENGEKAKSAISKHIILK